jgi:hypothetical protein
MVAWVVIFRLPARLATQFRHVTKYPSPQVLVDPPLTNCDAPNSFRIRSYENCRVSLVLSPHYSLSPNLYPLYSDILPHPFALFYTFLHSRKTQLLSFHAIPHSFTKTRGCGARHSPLATSFPRFASPPPSFLVNYLDPILHRGGLREHFPQSTQGPRSRV